MKHQDIMPTNKLLINSALIMLMVGVLDFMIIKEHPSIVESKPQKDDIDDLLEEFDSLDNDDLEEAELEAELKSYILNNLI